MSYSVTQLVAASTCEYQAVRAFELKTGLRNPACGATTSALCDNPQCVDHATDAMSDRLAHLGDSHEKDALARFIAQYGIWDPTTGQTGGVFRADLVQGPQRQALTTQAFAEKVPVLFQVEIQDGQLIGRADFVVLQPDGTYSVYDTKLARTARSSAVLQITAYSQALARQGVSMSRYGHLMLGSGEVTRHSVRDTEPVFTRLRARYENLVASRAGKPLATWGTAEHGGSGLQTCGRCSTCEVELEQARDVLLVMGCSTAHRVKLNAAGIYTVEQLAALAPTPTQESGIGMWVEADSSGIDINRVTLNKLVAQAQLFLAGETRKEHGGVDLYRVFDTKAFGLLKPENPGDIFFDFEGDPLYAEAGSTDWGLEYLFGWCTRELSDDGRPVFEALWAHNRLEEKKAFETFIDYLVGRVQTYPDMHVYHYAPYETTALKRLAARHGTREHALDGLLRMGLFIDLYAVVRGTLRTSGHSLSIKKLEPFYIDALGAAREGVTNAADSITEYAEAIELRQSGHVEAFHQTLDQIANYNRYDCESTFHLLNWIGEIAQEHGVNWNDAYQASIVDESALQEPEPDARATLVASLGEHLERLTQQWKHDIAHAHAHSLPDVPEPESRLITRMAWAAVEYNKRENKQYWWGHFARLQDPVEDWIGSEIFRPTRSQVAEDWHVPSGKRSLARFSVLYGQLEPGNKLAAGSGVFSFYDEPVPLGMKTSSSGIRAYHSAEIVDIEPVPGDADGMVAMTIMERASKTVEPWLELPVGLGPGAPISTTAIDQRLTDLGQSVLDALEANPDAPQFEDSARMRLLRRMGTVSESEGAAVSEDRAERILAALRDHDTAVVAVQGPPGAGKTFVASHVISTLVRAGWHIGVVAQSHAVVENVLRAVHGRGIPKEQIFKKPRSEYDPERDPFTQAEPSKIPDLLRAAHTGTVTGGTAWNFSAEHFHPEPVFDLLVIDEAGQYSMANSLAVSHASARMLLLGDPQQLPQVSQGTHPEPVNESALSWLVEDAPTIPSDRGFFLDETWRMHPALTHAVSELSYEGKLHSVALTQGREVQGLAPGVHTLLVEHHGNTASSLEEANAVVATISALVGTNWKETEQSAPQPLGASDFIVVAPYNAQVQLIAEQLDHAGLAEVSVGTVDKFQGQEAAIALVSLAVSDALNSPRGLEFVRNRNRLNVSISRGKHSAFLIHSPALLDAVENSIRGMEEHGAFIRLSEAGLDT